MAKNKGFPVDICGIFGETTKQMKNCCKKIKKGVVKIF